MVIGATQLNTNIPLLAQVPEQNLAEEFIKGKQAGQKLKQRREQRAEQKQFNELKIANEKFNQLDARQQQRLRSSIIGAAELRPLVEQGIETGDFTAANQFLDRRLGEIQQAKRLGVDVDDAETQDIKSTLQSNPKAALATLINSETLGRQLGVLGGEQGQGNVPAAIQVQREIDALRASGNVASAELLERTAKINPKGFVTNPQTGRLEVEQSFVTGQQDISGAKETGKLESQLELKPEIEAEVAQAKKRAEGLPTKIQELQDNLIDEVALGTSIGADLQEFNRKIAAGELNLNVIANLESKVKNNVALSSDESRNYQSFRSFIDKLRNDSLRLNKGVQTEGDAQRAIDELINNLNDPGLVSQRLSELQRINEKGVSIKEERLQTLRKENKQEPLSLEKIKGTAGESAFAPTSENIADPKKATDEEIKQFLGL